MDSKNMKRLLNKLDGLPMWYDKSGKPFTDDEDRFGEIEKLLRDPHYKRVGLTTVGKWQISTVWFGLDHNRISRLWLFTKTMVRPTSRNATQP